MARIDLDCIVLSVRLARVLQLTVPFDGDCPWFVAAVSRRFPTGVPTRRDFLSLDGTNAKVADEFFRLVKATTT